MVSIFFNVPNCIGYLRIILLIISLNYILNDWRTFLALYFLSQFLDAFDGLAARILDQSTYFGSMLDQLTDRVSSMCLLMSLTHFYKDYFVVIQLVVAIDIVSHWLHFFASSLQGKQSHKSSDVSTNVFLRLYYNNKAILFTTCAMYEVFFCNLLLIYHTQDSYLYLKLLAWICLPFVVFKILIHIIQIVQASKIIVQADYVTKTRG